MKVKTKFTQILVGILVVYFSDLVTFTVPPHKEVTKPLLFTPIIWYSVRIVEKRNYYFSQLSLIVIFSKIFH